MSAGRALVAGLAAALLAGGGTVAGAAGGAAMETEPLWEVNLGIGVARIPHYRGSDEHSIYAVPIPFLILRGRLVEADREGVRSVWVRRSWIESDLSFSGHPPPTSRTRAREGMARLRAIGEVGPAVHLYPEPERPPLSPYLWLTARAVFSADHRELSLRHEGYRVSAWVVLQEVRPDRAPEWRFSASAGVEWIDRGVAGLLYDVPGEAARPDRPPYRAGSGYAGFSAMGYAERTLGPRLSWGIHGRWDNIDGAVFADSPLVRRQNSVTIGSVLTWTLFASERRVPVRR